MWEMGSNWLLLKPEHAMMSESLAELIDHVRELKLFVSLFTFAHCYYYKKRSLLALSKLSSNCNRRNHYTPFDRRVGRGGRNQVPTKRTRAWVSFNQLSILIKPNPARVGFFGRPLWMYMQNLKSFDQSLTLGRPLLYCLVLVRVSYRDGKMPLVRRKLPLNPWPAQERYT